MNKFFEVEYNIDKLSLIYEATEVFNTVANISEVIEIPIDSENSSFLYDVSNEVFILTPDISKRGKYNLKFMNYTLSYVRIGEKPIEIGKILCHLQDAIILKVTNSFLYSDQLELIYLFEKALNLKFYKISELDICCDSTKNLPKKLDDILHSKKCVVTRPGRHKDKLTLTKKGNMKLGGKYVPNIKTLTEYERPEAVYDYSLKYSGANRPIKLRGYNKSKEIEESSHKAYILDALSFYDETIYRLEVSVNCYFITKQAKNKSGFSHKFIYDNLLNKDFLKSFFISIINRFYRLKINGTSITISKFLCLE